VAAADYAQYSILMTCIERLRKTAPGIRIAVREAPHSRMVKLLDTGAIDLGLLALDTAPDRLHHRILFTERYVLVARRRHPQLKGKITLDTLSRLDYVVVSPEGGGFRGATDGALESLGYKRKVVLSVPHFLIVPQVVARTDLVAMLPSRLVTERSDRIRVIEPPIRIPPFEMAIVWHERTHADARQTWLREQVMQCAM